MNSMLKSDCFPSELCNALGEVRSKLRSLADDLTAFEDEWKLLVVHSRQAFLFSWRPLEDVGVYSECLTFVQSVFDYLDMCDEWSSGVDRAYQLLALAVVEAHNEDSTLRQADLLTKQRLHVTGSPPNYKTKTILELIERIRVVNGDIDGHDHYRASHDKARKSAVGTLEAMLRYVDICQTCIREEATR